MVGLHLLSSKWLNFEDRRGEKGTNETQTIRRPFNNKHSCKRARRSTLKQTTHRLTRADLLCGLYGALQARPAQVNVLSVAVLRQQFEKNVHVQVVVIVDVTEPPATDQLEIRNSLCVCVCVALNEQLPYFFPERMKASYSWAILHERA